VTTSFIGPGSSAQLLEGLLRIALEWQSLHEPQGFQNTVLSLVSLSEGVKKTCSLPSFPIHVDYKKTDLYTSIPPSTQRSLVAHFLRVVQSEYHLLSQAQEAELVECEVPLKSEMRSLELSGVFAISTALVSRDIDTKFAVVAPAFRDSFLRIINNLPLISTDSIKGELHRVLAACFLAVLELIHPLSGELWELMGRTIATMERIRSHGLSQELIGLFQRLEVVLLKLEWYGRLLIVYFLTITLYFLLAH
jgi:hypothetical protein